MKFDNDEELKQFVEIAAMLKYYKAKGVPIPADIKDTIERNRNKNDVFGVLNEIIHD